MAHDANTAEIGVFGGSGFYSLLEDVREAKVDTPYGAPSDSIFLAEVAGRRVAFLPRHGRRHTIPPHRINYRANVWAMRSLGVKAVISPCAAGSLQLAVKPGDFVVCDQFVDRTSGRGRHVLRRPDRDPPVVRRDLRPGAARARDRHDPRPRHPRPRDGARSSSSRGPRFSTKSESKWFSDAGWEVINMTQYPEAWLCRELGMAVVNIALITDFDAGVHEGTEAVNATNVARDLPGERRPDPGGRARPDRTVPGRPGRARCPCRARADPRRRARHVGRRHPAVRDRPVTDARVGAGALPIGVCIRSIRAEPGWWLESARRLDAAGYAGVWSWDHFMGRGEPAVPVVEGWTILAMAAGATERVTVGPFVLNVMNRHPAVVARMASTLQVASGGRLILGIGIGGAPEGARGLRHRLPRGAGAGRPARGGRRGHPGAVDRRPRDPGLAVLPAARAHAYPIPTPPPPIIVGGETPAGARLAGRIGDGWSAFDANFEANLPLYLESLGPRAAGARTSGCSSGSRATGWATRRIATRRGSAAPRETGSAGRRPAPTARSSSPGRPGRRRPGRRGRALVGRAVGGTISDVTAP